LALFAQFGTYFFLAKVYRELIKIEERNNLPSFKSVLSLSFVSVFLNHIIPSGGISGNLFLFSSFSKREMSTKQSAGVVINESLTFYITYLLVISFAIFGLLMCSKIFTPHFFFVVMFLGLAFFLALMVFVSIFGQGASMSNFAKKISESRFFIFFSKKFQVTPIESIHLRNPWQTLYKNKKLTMRSIAFQILIFLCDAFTVFALFKGLDVSISFWLVFLAFVPTTIIGALPISPGSLIVYESGMVFFYISLGIPFSVVFIITLMYRALSFWLTIPVGLFLYRKIYKYQRV
jgi:uncharacterized protein (TIRG00374 family)